ncbi:MAG: hypothetical protein GYA17_19385 [Chloroflexi bacterium]|nr:hypothetical protein [Anaerolineaceae bacterium]NMB90532.1 hypothetical protein [Chloroflexota bacterium]
MNIAILYNSFAYKHPLPEEQEMRDTGLSIGRRLAARGHTVQYFDVDDPQRIEALCNSQVDVAFDACERVRDDARGEAYAAALLEYLGIPHTRTRAWLIALGVSKVRVKSILAYHHIPTPRYQIFHSCREALLPGLQFPLFVKGLASENSIGIDEHSLVNDPAELKAKIRQINTRLGQPALVEEYIDGRELTVSILPGSTGQALPISEIVFDGLPANRRFLDYNAKWHAGSEQFQKSVPVCPARLNPPDCTRVTRVALACYAALGLDSYARIDLRYRAPIPYVLEVNQNPSIDEKDSGYVRACQGNGLDYDAMLDALLCNALERNNDYRRIGTRRTGSFPVRQNEYDLHPVETARL